MSVGRLIVRGRWAVVAAWAAGAAALLLAVPAIDPARTEPASLLPAWAVSRRATEALREAFPAAAGLSEAAIVFERADAPLSPQDLLAIEGVARRLRQAAENDPALAGAAVRSPASLGLPAGAGVHNPLLARSGRAGLVLVSLPTSYVTIRCSRAVERIRSFLHAADLPEGLAPAVTGSAAFGHDYAEAGEESHRRTLYVTLAAVVVILLAVYRAPVAAMIPLGAISLAAVVAMSVLGIASRFGLHVGTAERIFVFVLLYGAGTDYSLLLISRCREELQAGRGVAEATATGLDATFGAILASAGTDAAGLLMLVFAQYTIFRTTGPAVAIALLVALAAAVTLVPALLAVLGRGAFWPGTGPGRIGQRRLWPAVGRAVTARPGAVLLVVLVLLAIPAGRALDLTWVYDTLAEATRPSGDRVANAAEGLEAARRHWPAGQTAPVRLLVRAGSPRPAAEWEQPAADLTAAVLAVEGVEDVRSLTRPLGRDASPAATALIRSLAPERIRGEYVSADGRSTRLEVVLSAPALTLDAMRNLGALCQAARSAASRAGLDAEVLPAGATAEMADTRDITQRDFRRIAALVLGVIFVIVLMLLRDAILTAFMVGSLVLGYLATLGASYWVFTGLLGAAGLDWKVEVFLFVVISAVGVDYNIFLAARFAQEARAAPPRQAVRRAVVHTGPVISSCGVIMAATLGSLMAGRLTLLQQLGFALALGMVVDTFIIRPLLLPAFVVLTRRRARGGRALDTSPARAYGQADNSS